MDSPFNFPSPGWSLAGELDVPDFDTYYEGYGFVSEDEETIGVDQIGDFPESAAHLPHIKVTSH